MKLRPRSLSVLAALWVTTLAGAQAPPPPAKDASVADKASVCAACHGPNGNSANPQYPVLAGQNARYLYLQLKDFKEGRRHDAAMAPFVAKLSPQEMLDLAEYFAAQ